MIAKFNNIRPENFERLSRFVESDQNFINVTRRSDDKEVHDVEDDLDSKEDRVRIVKILTFGKDTKAHRNAMFVDLIMKDWVIDYVEVPGKGWKRARLPIPRDVVDIVFDCLGILPVEIEPIVAEVEDPAVAAHIRERFEDIADRFAEERVPTEAV
ncbi:hypothetical protein HZB94_03910 [Candidatus Falkowbacteria bacterium]|nr:hypothetical protein [Candidatus Falkowbacteria bacterium]